MAKQFGAIDYADPYDLLTNYTCRNGNTVDYGVYGRLENYNRKKYNNSRYSGKYLRSRLEDICLDPNGKDEMEEYVSKCADGSEASSESCAWACTGQLSKSWACPGEAKCINTKKICDGIPDCENAHDENPELCTEDFCRDGFIERHGDRIQYELRDVSMKVLKRIYLFRSYHTNQAKDNVPEEIKNEKGVEMFNWGIDPENNLKWKCPNSTRCIRGPINSLTYCKF